MAPVIETERLRLRSRTIADLDDNWAMDMDPQVHRFIWSKVPEPDAYRAELEMRITSEWPHRGGLWVVEWKDRPGFLGWSAVFPLPDSDQIELGYRFNRKAWGQGVATEAGHAVLAFGFEHLGFDPILAVTDFDNHASQHVLHKLGFRDTGPGTYRKQPVLTFRLDYAAFAAQR
ncbi:MAG TPA: GNAT family N-acetyltransferase [Magnetospirillaceae bacterium]|jgi:RimJ/RimL family protein N-acetyltransferase